MLAFVVVVPVAEVEIAADRLFQLGVAAVEERTAELEGHVELWTEVGDSADSIATAATSLPADWPWRTVTIDESVAGSWRRFATPTWVTDEVVIVPAWLRDDAETGDALAIAIDPGAAFGMGDHPTTQLTLRALVDELHVRRGAIRVLDVGCGSGVLAIAAARLGATRVVAIDIATAAIEATETNAEANGVSDAVTASTTPIAHVDGTFDVVLANVLAPALIAMAPDLRRVLAPGGVLIISGILADRHQHVLDAIAPLVPMTTRHDEGWVAVTLSRVEEPLDLVEAGE